MGGGHSHFPTSIHAVGLELGELDHARDNVRPPSSSVTSGRVMGSNTRTSSHWPTTAHTSHIGSSEEP